MFKKYADIILASIIFGFILIMKYDFYKVLSLILEFMVIIEITQMLFVFFKKQRIKIRYMIDASIIFFIRELLIATTTNKSFKVIGLYVVLIGVFFFFRYLSLNVTYSER
ncbi:phosphate-starvation-inducible PsiE family protein [Caminibacter profundus]